MFTEEQILARLSFTRDWTPELRAQLVAGLGKLQGCRSPLPDLTMVIGVVLICEHQAGVRIMTKEDAADEARHNGICEEMIGAILSPPQRPNTLEVLLVAGEPDADEQQIVVFGIPVKDVEFELAAGTTH